MTYEESLRLSGNDWTSLDDQQKIEVLQTIENHVALENNRAECPVVGRFMYTGNDGIVLGAYSPDEERIYINTSQFDEYAMYGANSDRLITTVLHEGRHALQHQVANGTVEYNNQEEAQLWKENLAPGNYIDYKDNPRAYYNQPVEVDARSFAEHRFAELEQERMELQSCQEDSDNMVSIETAYGLAKETFEAQMKTTQETECFNNCSGQNDDQSMAADYTHQNVNGQSSGIKI